MARNDNWIRKYYSGDEQSIIKEDKSKFLKISNNNLNLAKIINGKTLIDYV